MLKTSRRTEVLLHRLRGVWTSAEETPCRVFDMPLINQTLDTVYQRFVSRVRRDASLERLESFSFTYTSNGKYEFVPLDQVFPFKIVAYCLLLLHKNN